MALYREYSETGDHFPDVILANSVKELEDYYRKRGVDPTNKPGYAGIAQNTSGLYFHMYMLSSSSFPEQEAVKKEFWKELKTRKIEVLRQPFNKVE